MHDLTQSPGCKQYRGEILEYFRRPEDGTPLSDAARKHYEECVECVAAVVSDAFSGSADDFQPSEDESPELRELRQVFADWGMETAPPDP
jgi:hypothetical protein